MNKTDKVEKMLREAGVDVERMPIHKQGREVTGLCIGSGKIRPVIYPEIDSRNTMEIVDDALEELNMGTSLIKEVDDLLVWEKCKGQIRLCARKPELDGCATMPFLDFEIYCEVLISDYASMKIKEEHMKVWDVTFDDVLNAAEQNTKEMAVFERMIKKMLELADIEPDREMEELMETDQTGFITYRDGRNGAGIIYCKEFIEEIRSWFGDFYIIPSSIHELMIRPATEDVEEMRQMHIEVQEEAVQPHERLSENIYICTARGLEIA